MKTFARILAVTFAISMLAAYVVYSQLQQNRNIAPGSKGMVIGANAQDTNQVDARFSMLPGSKSFIPIVEIPTSTTEVVSNDHSDVMFSSSKSTKVFKFKESARDPNLLTLSNSHAASQRSDLVFPGSKSGAMFRLEPATLSPVATTDVRRIRTTTQSTNHTAATPKRATNVTSQIIARP